MSFGRRLLDAGSDLLERVQLPVALALMLLVLLSAIGRSSWTLLSYDEQVTLRIARLPVNGIWSFFSAGLDTTGPVTALIAHVALALPQSPELSIRFPFTLAFIGMCWGVWRFLRGRYPAGFSLAVLALPLNFVTITYFRTDARPYAFMLCAAGAGLGLWQMASEGRHRPWSVFALWAVLALGMCAHFFTIFAMFPFAVAQWVRYTERGRCDWPVWAAILSFPVAWLPLAPGELKAHGLYAGTFWSKPTLANLGDPYDQLISPNWGIVFILVLFFLAVVLVRFWLRRYDTGSVREGVRYAGLLRAEWSLLLAFLMLPLVAWIASLWIGAFHHYYVASFEAGVLALIVTLAAELSERKKQLGTVFFVCVVGLALGNGGVTDAVQGANVMFDHGEVHRDSQKSFQSLDWVRRLKQSHEPVMADNATAAKLFLYGDAVLAGRTYAITNPEIATTYPGASTDVTNMRLFGSRLGYQVAGIEDFLSGNPRFLLIQQRVPYPSQWLSRYLLAGPSGSQRRHLQADLFATEGDVIVFEACSEPSC